MVAAVTLPSWLDADRLKTIAVLVVGALLAFAVVSAWLIKKTVVKVVTLGVLLGLAAGIWTQRANLSDCAAQVASQPTAGATCTFFGFEVTVPGVPSPT